MRAHYVDIQIEITALDDSNTMYDSNEIEQGSSTPHDMNPTRKCSSSSSSSSSSSFSKAPPHITTDKPFNQPLPRPTGYPSTHADDTDRCSGRGPVVIAPNLPLEYLASILSFVQPILFPTLQVGLDYIDYMYNTRCSSPLPPPSSSANTMSRMKDKMRIERIEKEKCALMHQILSSFACQGQRALPNKFQTSSSFYCSFLPTATQMDFENDNEDDDEEEEVEEEEQQQQEATMKKQKQKQKKDLIRIKNFNQGASNGESFFFPSASGGRICFSSKTNRLKYGKRDLLFWARQRFASSSCSSFSSSRLLFEGGKKKKESQGRGGRGGRKVEEQGDGRNVTVEEEEGEEEEEEENEDNQEGESEEHEDENENENENEN